MWYHQAYCEVKHGQNQDEHPSCRDRRGRNDARAVAVGEGHPHHPLCGSQDGVLRPLSREPRRDGRQGDRGRSGSVSQARRGREVRHHNPQRAARGGVRAEEDVGEPQRDHPCQDGRYGVPCARHRARHNSARARLEEAYRHCPSRVRRRIQGRGDEGEGRQGGAELRRQLPHRVRLRRQGGHPAGDPQHESEHRELRAQLLQLRARHKDGPVVLHQGHHLQDIRPHLQGHLRGDLRGGVQREVRSGGDRVFLHPHRRRGRARHALRGRLHLGAQEL